MNIESRQQRSDCLLKEIKNESQIRLFVFDYDGVLYGRSDPDPDYHTHSKAKELLHKIVLSGKHVGIISARDASFKKEFLPFFIDLSKNNPRTALYIGSANGSNVDKILSGTVTCLYEHTFLTEDAHNVIDIFKSLGLTLDTIDPTSRNVFEGFLAADWKGYINDELLTLSKEGKGLWWIEKSKMTIALPADRNKQKQIISILREKTKDIPCVVSWAHDAFAHITPKLTDDGKKLAAESIQKDLSIRRDQIIAFGDTPHGNDADLLTFPNSFTNYFNWTGNEPPYIIPKNGSPVASVHSVIHTLLS